MNIQTPMIEKLHRMRSSELPADPYRFPFWTPEQKPASKTDAEAATDAKVLPPVIEVPPRDLAAEVAELCEPISSYLDGFVIAEQPDHFSDGYRNPLSTERYAQPEKSPEVAQFEARKTALLRDLGTWKNALRNFLADHRTWRTAELRAEYEIAWREAREQKAVVASLATQINEGGEELRHRKAELSTARSKVNAHAAAKPSLASLPTQTQIDVWQAKDTELRAACRAAEEAVDKALERQRDLLRESDREKAVLTKHLQHEADLRRRLGGDAVTLMGLRDEPEL